MNVSDKAVALWTIAIVAVPWAVVTLVAILKGYSVAAYKEPKPPYEPKHRGDDD